MDRSNFPPKSYGQSDMPPTSTSNTNAVLSNSSTNPTPTSTSNTNAVLSNSSTNPTPSPSNLNTIDNTGKKRSSPKTRIPRSPRVRQKTEQALSGQSSKIPISARKRELDKKSQNSLTESSLSESEKKHSPRSGTLSDSVEDDVQVIKEVGILDAISEETVGSNRPFSEPKLSVRLLYDVDETLTSSTISESQDIGPAPSYIAVLAQKIWDAIDTKDWDRLDHLTSSMRAQGFRFDSPLMSNTHTVNNIITMAPLALLGANEHAKADHYDIRWMFALDLLDLGCDWNAKDRSGHRAIDLLRKQATPQLTAYVVENYPNLRHLFK